MPESLFLPASRHQLKGRIVLDGPTGAGKTFTALTMARELAGPDGKIGFIDTERRSAELYSDQFEFQVLNWVPPYDPRKLAKVLKDHDGLFDVMVLDSGTHFWKGEGGTLDIVEAAGQRAGGNNYAGWNQGTPALRSMIDTMLGMECHFIMCLRSKMDYVLETNDKGKQVPRQVGMAPEMRNDINYEFTLAVSMDQSHQGTVTKSRCSTLADALIRPGDNYVIEAMDLFRTWLAEGAPPPELVDEDYRTMLRKWANALPPARKAELRELWPIGVPQLSDDDLTAQQAERVEKLLSSFGPPPEAVAAEAQGDGGEPDKAEGAAKAAPAKKAAAKKAPAKKAPAKKAAATTTPPPADEAEAPAEDEVQPDEGEQAPPDEAPSSAEAAAEAPTGTEAPDAPADGAQAADGGEAAQGEPIDWRAVGDDLGIGRANVLNAARDLAAERGMPQPPGLTKVSLDLDYQGALMERLELLAQAQQQREGEADAS